MQVRHLKEAESTYTHAFKPDAGILNVNKLSRTLALFVCALACWLGQALAQLPETPDKRLDQARSQLDQIEASLARTDQSDAALQALRLQLDPVAATIDDVITQLSPRLAAVKSRLELLVPKAAEKSADKPTLEKSLEKASPEPALPDNIAAESEKADQEKLYKDIDGSLRRAKALAVETEQTINQIQDRRRAIFTRALFEQSSSLFRPALWLEVMNGLPHDVRAARTVTGDWISSQVRNLEGWRLPVLGALLSILLALGWPMFVIAERVIARHPHTDAPTRLKRVMASWAIVLVMVSLPVAFLLAFVVLMAGFGLDSKPVQPAFNAIAEGLLRIAIISALARGLFSPVQANWRLLPIGDKAAQELTRLAIEVAVILSLAKLFYAFADMIGAALPLVVAVRGTGALLAALVLSGGLRGLAAAREADGPQEISSGRNNIIAIVRLLAWLAIIAIIAAVVVGYISLAVFLADQIIWIAGIGMVLYLALALAEESIPASFKPGAPVGRALAATIGMRPAALDQVGILLTGAIQLALYAIAIVLNIAPWGVQSDDFAGSLRTAFFGFKVGDVTVSLSNIAIALLLFSGVLGVTRAIQQWLETRFLPHTQLDLGLRNSIKTSLGYAGFILAMSFALSHLGLGFDKLAIVAGALSVGIGFGLQSIVNNFVSGLILLWERTIRVGDWIVVGEDQGYVRRINVRSTEIETFDRSTVIVPNSNLVSGVVKNWLRGDRIGRIRIQLNFDASADIEAVRELMVRTAKNQEMVIKIPAPTVMFADLTDTGAKLDLFCYVEDVETAARVRSDLLFDIHKQLRALGQMDALVNHSATRAGLRALLEADVPAPKPKLRST